jgi:hypothetical protein
VFPVLIYANSELDDDDDEFVRRDGYLRVQLRQERDSDEPTNVFAFTRLAIARGEARRDED